MPHVAGSVRELERLGMKLDLMTPLLPGRTLWGGRPPATCVQGAQTNDGAQAIHRLREPARPDRGFSRHPFPHGAERLEVARVLLRGSWRPGRAGGEPVHDQALELVADHEPRWGPDP